MEIVNLYKYEVKNGFVISPNKPQEGIEYELRYRLIADEGMAITNDGEAFHSVIDVEDIEGWYEVEYDFDEAREIHD